MNNMVWVAVVVAVVAVAALFALKQGLFSSPGKVGPDGKPLPGQRIDGAQAKALVAEGAALIDVRTPGEFAGGAIDGARNIPVQVLDQRMDEIGDKAAPVVVYCASGMRSNSAMRSLQAAGFQKVYDLGPKGAWH